MYIFDNFIYNVVLLYLHITITYLQPINYLHGVNDSAYICTGGYAATLYFHFHSHSL